MEQSPMHGALGRRPSSAADYGSTADAADLYSAAVGPAPSRWGVCAPPVAPPPAPHPPTPVPRFLMAPGDVELPPPDQLPPSKPSATLQEVIASILATMLVAVVSVLDNAPYGLILFPKPLNNTLAPVGVAMVLSAAAISQLVLSLSSAFPSAVGCMVVENLPFLTLLASHSAQVLTARGQPGRIASTCVLLWTLSTGLTGVVMLALGRLRAGRLTAFFPKHVLLGCVAGMGAFILTAGVSITTGVEWEYTPDALHEQTSGHRLWRLVLAVALTAVVPVLRESSLGSSPLVLPSYLLSLPCIFWAVVVVCGWESVARAEGWFIDTTADGGVGPYDGLLPWMLLAGEAPAWDLVPDSLLTIFGVAVFTTLHVPINAPALSVTTGVQMDLDHELEVHGYANLLCAAQGGLQSYMTCATSALLYRCGGGGRIGGFCIAAFLFLVAAAGPVVLGFFPRPVAGVVLLLIGYDLIFDGLVASRSALSGFELSQVLLVVISMQWLGFLQGLGVGLVLACASYLIAGASADPVECSGSAAGMRSKQLRPPEAQRLLDERLGEEVHVLRLSSSSLFFGNSVSVVEHCAEAVRCRPAMSHLVLHFASSVAGADCTAADALAKLARHCHKMDVACVFSGLPPAVVAKVRFADTEVPAHYTDTIDKALVWCEDRLLRAHGVASELCVRGVSLDSLEDMLEALSGNRTHGLQELARYCVREEVAAGKILWRAGDDSDTAVLLQSGLLGVPASLNPHLLGCQPQTSQVCPMCGPLIELSVPGQLSGEITALTGEQRRATLVAVERSVLWTFSVAAIRENAAAFQAAQTIGLRLASHRLRHLTLLGHLHSV